MSSSSSSPQEAQASPPPTEQPSPSSLSPTEPSSLLRQTLMTVEECFLYKVPPLVTASGYRANDWNLGAPLETCGFQVERRDNDLYLLFTLDNHSKLYAQAKVRGVAGALGAGGDQQMMGGSNYDNNNIEPVVDSSRYFVTKIQNPHHQARPGSRADEAVLGFGFRDREVAIDLLGNLQQFQRSIQREVNARTMKVVGIPQLKDGAKMHISLPAAGRASQGGPSSSSSKRTAATAAAAGHPPSHPPSSSTTGGGGGGGGGPFLLKIPPPPAASAAAVGSGSAGPRDASIPLSQPDAATKIMGLVRDNGENDDDDEENDDDDDRRQSAGAAALSPTDKMEQNSNNVNSNMGQEEEDDDDDDFGDFQGA